MNDHPAGDSGRSYVVTGAASGIGLAITHSLLAAGYAVIGLDLDAERLEGVRGDLPDPSRFAGIVGDVADEASHREALAEAVGRAPLGGWVNNAGYDVTGSIHECDAAIFERCLGVNFGGVFWGAKTAVSEFLRTGAPGSIVNMSSGQARFGVRRYPLYAASKGAIISLTRQLAAEYADRGIRCNAIAPGVIATPMADEILAGADDPDRLRRSWNALCPIGRLGTPEDVAELAMFLLSDKAGFITGEVVVIDGGQAVVPSNHFVDSP